MTLSLQCSNQFPAVQCRSEATLGTIRCPATPHSQGAERLPNATLWNHSHKQEHFGPVFPTPRGLQEDAVVKHHGEIEQKQQGCPSLAPLLIKLLPWGPDLHRLPWMGSHCRCDAHMTVSEKVGQSNLIQHPRSLCVCMFPADTHHRAVLKALTICW